MVLRVFDCPPGAAGEPGKLPEGPSGDMGADPHRPLSARVCGFVLTRDIRPVARPQPETYLRLSKTRCSSARSSYDPVPADRGKREFCWLSTLGLLRAEAVDRWLS